MDFAAVSRAAALFRLQVTQPSGSRPCAPCTIAKVVSEDDPAEWPSFPVQRSAPMAERDRLQPRQPLAAARATQEDRRLVVDQLAAQAGEDGRSSGETCPLLLAALGGESSHATLVWSHAGQDRCSVLSRGLGEPPSRADFKRRAGRGRKGVAGIGRERVRFVLCDSYKW